jgi:hypothetical protein
MAVWGDARIKNGMALINTAGKHDVVCGNGSPAKAGAEGDSATEGQRPGRHPDVGFHDQFFGVIIDQEDAPPSLQGEPGQLDKKAEGSAHLLIQGGRPQGNPQDAVERLLDQQVLFDLLRRGLGPWPVP